MWAPRYPVRTAARGSPKPGFLALSLLLLLFVSPEGQGRAVSCISGRLPNPTNITFLSINMENILQWSPPQDLQGVEVTYKVQYLIYGKNKWLKASQCRNINRTYCDLSAETSDYEHQYYARVKAIWKTNCSKWVKTARFNPFTETRIGPPKVALTNDEKSISVILTAPEKWKKDPEENSIFMQQIFPNLKYNVSVHNTKSNRTWSQCVTNHTLVLNWLEPGTLYCVHVESFVPGPPRLARPSETQCVKTSKGHSSFLTVKIIFCYILPISITMFIFSVTGYSIYRYIHVKKEKHPTNLILIYGEEFDKRFFVPAEKFVVNFVTLSTLEETKISHKDENLTERSKDLLDLNDAESNIDQDSPQEEMEVKHLGYASHLVDILCESQESISRTSLTQQETVYRTIRTSQTVIEYECDIRTTSMWAGPKDQELISLEEGSKQGKLFEQQLTLADLGPQTLLFSHIPQLRDLDPLPQEDMDTGGQPEEESLTTLVNWDPQTGRLCMSSLPNSDCDAQECEHSGYMTLTNLLSQLYQEQTPHTSSEENENSLMQFMEDWELSMGMEGD